MPPTAQKSSKNRVRACVSIARVMVIARRGRRSTDASTISRPSAPGHRGAGEGRPDRPCPGLLCYDRAAPTDRPVAASAGPQLKYSERETDMRRFCGSVGVVILGLVLAPAARPETDTDPAR